MVLIIHHHHHLSSRSAGSVVVVSPMRPPGFRHGGVNKDEDVKEKSVASLSYGGELLDKVSPEERVYLSNEGSCETRVWVCAVLRSSLRKPSLSRGGGCMCDAAKTQY